MSVKKEAEKLYDDWLIWYSARKLLWKQTKPKFINNFDVSEVSEFDDLVTPWKTISKEKIIISTDSSNSSDIDSEVSSNITTNEDNKDILKESFKDDIAQNLKGKQKDDEVIIDWNISEIFQVNTNLLNLIWNSSYEEHRDHIAIDWKFVTYVWFGSEDSSVDGQIMEFLCSSDDIWNFSMHSIFEPISPLASKKILLKKRRQFKTELEVQIKKKWSSNVDPDLFHSVEELNNVIEWLTSWNFKMYKHYTVIQLVDEDLESLRNRIEQVRVSWETMNYSMTKFLYIQDSIHNCFWISWSNDAFFELNSKKQLPYLYSTDESLSFFSNFIFKEEVSVRGIPIWNDIWTSRVICRDLWGGDNYNCCIFWVSGSWKSYTVKLLALREYNDWVRQIIIDPDWEFEKLTKNIGWDYVNISPGVRDEEKINPFDFTFPRQLISKFTSPEDFNLDEYKWVIANEFKSHLNNLKRLVAIIIFSEKLSSEYYSEISTLLFEFFTEVWGIDTSRFDTYFALSQNPLSLRKFHNFLLEKSSWKSDNQSNRISYIAKWLFDYAHENWNYSWYLWNGFSSIDLAWDWTAFNLKQIKDPGPLTVVTYILITFIEQIFAERQEQRTRLIIDEASTFLSANIETASFIAKLFQRARKYYLWVTVIAQWINNLYVDFKSDEKNENFWDTIVQNTENMVILSQKSNAIQLIAQKLDPSPKEVEFFEDLRRSKENWEDVRWRALIITWTSHDQVQITAESYIHKYITTDPSEHL